MQDVVIIGGGIIGLSVAWRTAQRGATVTVLDPSPGTAATATAAGMLAPVTELHFEGRELLALNLESARRYPAFAAELADATGIDVDLRPIGTLAVAWDAADLADLRRLHAFQESLGVASAILTSRELREAEPALAAGLPGGLYAEHDHAVDNRRVHEALLAAAIKAGVTIHEARAAEITRDGDRVTGVVAEGGERFRAEQTVLAAGPWSRDIPGLRGGEAPPVRPVKGQTLRLRAKGSLLNHVVRGFVKGKPIYMVPRSNGDVVVGATAEEAGFDVRPRAGAIYDLLRDAATLVPEVTEATFVEVSTGLRPGSPDNAPMIGAAAPGLIVATGHYRNGILLAPITGDEVARLIIEGDPSPVIAPFGPGRFVRTEVTA